MFSISQRENSTSHINIPLLIDALRNTLVNNTSKFASK